MFRFAHPEYFYLWIGIPILVLLFCLYVVTRRRAMRKFCDLIQEDSLAPDRSKYKAGIKFSLMLIAFVLMVLVLARPQFGYKQQVVKRDGVEVIVALDVSNSMMASDIKPNRLEVAKQMISGLIDKLRNDRVGLIIFAGSAYTQLPITTDLVSAKMFLKTINPAVIPKQGTAIGEALSLAMQSFSPASEGKGRMILVITDGEDHEGAAIKYAKLAQEKGIRVVTMGLGEATGSPIPLGRTKDFLKDGQGEVVMSYLNEDMLKEIAEHGGGEYIKGSNNTRRAINAIQASVASMEKSETESTVFENYDEQFQYIAIVVFLLLLVDCLILSGKSPLFRNVRLFK